MTMLDIAFGVHEKRPPATTMAEFRGARYTREFFNTAGEVKQGADLIALLHEAADATWEAGGVPTVSFKLKPAEVAVGIWDEPVRKLGAELARCPHTVVIFYHEPEDNYPGAVMAKAFNRVRSQLKQGRSDLPVCYCAGSYAWRPADAAGKRHTVDVDAWRSIEADIYLCDVYSGNSFPADTVLPEHSGFARWKKEIVDAVPGRKWGLGERGWAPSPGRSSTMLRELEWLLGLADPNMVMYLLWSTPDDLADWPFTAAEKPVIQKIATYLSVPVGWATLPGTPDLAVHDDTGLVVHRPKLPLFEDSVLPALAR